MAFTISNLEGFKPKDHEDPKSGDDWRSLILENTKKDELSLANEMMRDRQKKENYKNLLDMQNKYISHLKQNQNRQESNEKQAERSYLTDQYNQETDFKIGQRMKSMEKQKLINDQNKFLYNIKSKQQNLSKNFEGSEYKENPIEYRLRMDNLRKLEKNKVRERDILEYNNNTLKMLKMRQQHKKEKDKYYSEEFNNHVEKQAVTHLLNRTSQQEKYESKRQQRDFMALKDRTIAVKNKVDDLINKYREANNDNSPQMKELLEMQTTIRKCVIDLNKGEKMQPTSLDTYSKEIQSKNNVILDWQVNNKKIAEIEKKLMDKEYYEYIRNKLDQEVDEINRNYLKKKAQQQQYLNELQQQDKYYKQLRRNEDQKLSFKEQMLNKRGSGSQLDDTSIRNLSSAGGLDKYDHINKTIDVNELRHLSPNRLHQIANPSELNISIGAL